MTYGPRSAAKVLCFIYCLAFSSALYSQEFTAVDRDLAHLESLIADTLLNTVKQQKLLEDLQRNLNESGILIGNYENIITGQEQLLEDLQAQLNRMSETYRKQSVLSAKYARNSKFWRTFTLIAIPVTAVLSGTLVLAAK